MKRYNLTVHECRKGHQCNDMAVYEDGEWVKYADAQATVEALQAQLKDMVLRNKILRDRLDLPPERCAFHDEVVSLQARAQELEEWVQDQSTANLSQRY